MGSVPSGRSFPRSGRFYFGDWWARQGEDERLPDAVKRIGRESERPDRDVRAGPTRQGWFRAILVVGPAGLEPATKRL